MTVHLEQIELLSWIYTLQQCSALKETFSTLHIGLTVQSKRTNLRIQGLDIPNLLVLLTRSWPIKARCVMKLKVLQLLYSLWDVKVTSFVDPL